MMETYNLAFERIAISAMIFDPAQIDSIKNTLYVNDFYLSAHQDLFEIIIELHHDTSAAVDEEFIVTRLKNKNKFDESVLLEILTCNPIGNINPYIQEIKKQSQKRRIIALGMKMQHESDLDISEELSFIESELKNIIDQQIGADKLDIIPINQIEDRETEFILKHWLPMPRGTLSMLFAKGGTGKSWGAAQMALQHVKSCKSARVALWLSEDPDYETKGRSRAIATNIMMSTLSQYENVHVVRSRPKHIVKDKKFNTNAFYKMRQNLKGYDLIVLDPLRSFYGGDENDNSQANMFMGAFQDWAAEENINIVFVHHASKNGEHASARGASAFQDACRTVYEIDKIYINPRTHDLDQNRLHEREFSFAKDNYGAIRFLNSEYKFYRQITPRASAREVTIEYKDAPKLEENELKIDMATL